MLLNSLVYFFIIKGEYRVQKDRLTNEYMKLLSDFQQVASASIKKAKENSLNDLDTSNVAYKRALNEEFSYNPNVYRVEEDSQKQKQIKQNENLQLVIERDKQMKQLESDIVDLNHMFKDLAVMVHDQGELIGKKNSEKISKNEI